MPSSNFSGEFTQTTWCWVPPLIIERKAFLDRKRHPFYRHGDAALFLARQNGEIVGRDHGERRSELPCCTHQVECRLLGLFECINDRGR